MTKITDALPHGAKISPEERVVVDYYIYGALGGENTTTVLRPKIFQSPVRITDGSSSFVVVGDKRSSFPTNHLLSLDQEQVYYLGAPTYDSVLDQTTVTLESPQIFRDSYTNPKIRVSSGPVSQSSTLGSPSYFLADGSWTSSTPRGMNKIALVGDQSSTYRLGVVINFAGLTFNDFYLSSGATYQPSSDLTEVTLTSTTLRQYTYGSCTHRRSVRPIFEASPLKVQTSTSPAIPPADPGDPPNTLLDTVLLYRKESDSPGRLLVSPTDFEINTSGEVFLATPLLKGEEVSIFYTKYRSLNPCQFRASYTYNIAPNASNGLLNQKLVGNFTTLVPDSFYFRVETMTNFRAFLSAKYASEAKSSAPSSGPRVNNTAQPTLSEQGQKSIFFDEGFCSNEDIVARAILKVYNDLVNSLEEVREKLEGLVVGDWDGKFKFDGTTGSVVSSFSAATNQIDDSIKISEFPVIYNPGPTYLGTYIQAYEPGAQSRFYPMKFSGVGFTLTGSDDGAKTGDQLIDFKTTNLTGSDPTVYRRLPRALVTQEAKAGDTTLVVDNTALVSTPPYRPAFEAGMKIVVQGPSGTYYVPQSAPLTVSGVSSTELEVGPLPLDVPRGATVYLGTGDSYYQKSYRVGTDLNLNLEKGYLLYVEPYFPFDGTDPLVPVALNIQAPEKDELLQGAISMTNSTTAPRKFPALLGQAFDDSGDQRLPLINPSLGGDSQLLEVQESYVSTGGILGVLASPYVGVGTLNAALTTISLDSGTFPTPAPKVGDLVRILDKENANSNFHRILSVTASSVTVDVAFALASSSFNFLVTVADNLATGTFTSI